MCRKFADNFGCTQGTVAVEKCEGPTCCIICLGIEIDSVEMEMRLPQEKLAHLAETI